MKKNQLGKNNSNWKGGKSKTADGRIRRRIPEHPRANNGYVLQSIVFAEKALGKPLPPEAEVHHFDENTSNDRKNLVLCENRKYHRLLHCRKKAYDACGNAKWRKCSYCQQYDEPKNLYIKPYNNHGFHRGCRAKNQETRRKQGESWK